MALQTVDVLNAMQEDASVKLAQLKVDGGASVNNALMQFQADVLNVPVVRPVVSETTALGAAYLAGLAVGFWKDTAEVSKNWSLGRRFLPVMSDQERASKLSRWRRAVQRTLDWDR